MVALAHHRQPPPTAQDIAIARQSGQRLSRYAGRKRPLMFQVGEEPVELPAGAVALLTEILEAMGTGRAVTIIPENAELTTFEAADMLNVSRTFLIELLEKGKIPFRKVGTHRRIRTDHVMAYKDEIDRKRDARLDELTRESERLELYGTPKETAKRRAVLDQLLEKKDIIRALAEQFGVRRLRVFGSISRREERPGSDIDFVAEFPKGYSMFKQRLPLAEKLEELTGRKVELIPEHELNKRIARGGPGRGGGIVSKDWRLYAERIVETVEKIRRVEERGDIRQDEALYAASLRFLQTLSETTQKLPEELKKRHAEIDWKGISGFRNILVHSYLGSSIDEDTVVDIIDEQLGQLQSAVKKMLEHE